MIAALGLAFKPDIDDLRESPARRIVRAAAAASRRADKVLAVEPNIDELPAGLAALATSRLADARRRRSTPPTSSCCWSTTTCSAAVDPVGARMASCVIDTKGL